MGHSGKLLKKLQGYTTGNIFLLIHGTTQSAVFYSHLSADMEDILAGQRDCDLGQVLCLADVLRLRPNLTYITNWKCQLCPIQLGLFHNTLHTLILAMLIAPFVYYLKSRFHFSHYVDSLSFTSMEERSILKSSAVPWQ